MTSVQRSLIAPTAHPSLEQALAAKLKRRSETVGSLGELEPLAIRLGLIQNTLKPRFRHPQMLVFAGDHGLVVDGLAQPGQSTSLQVRQLLTGQLPLPVFAGIQGLSFTVVDAGVAEKVEPHPRLLARKIAHGTRNCRVGPAMSVEQAHAAIRAGMEIADTLPGNVLACAGIGIGTHETAALVLARLAGVPVRDFIIQGPNMPEDMLTHWTRVLEGAQERHANVSDPVEVMAAFGGFEIAMMVGAVLRAASQRRLVVVDGFIAGAAIVVAHALRPAVLDYCVFAHRSDEAGHRLLLEHLGVQPLLDLRMRLGEGSGAALAWPLMASSLLLLEQMASFESAGVSDRAPA